MSNTEILEQLIFQEVEKIRAEHKKRTGVRQDILDSGAIVEIAAEMPEDVEKVKSFMKGGGSMKDAYAKRILDVIDGYRAETCVKEDNPVIEEDNPEDADKPALVGGGDGGKSVPSGPRSGTDIDSVLANLSLKLVDLGKTSGRIRIPSLGHGYKDMSFLNIQDILGFDFKIELCDRNKSDADADLFEEYNTILYMSMSRKRDSGQNSLNLAYPFLTGCPSDFEFAIRAPLMTIPVTLERDRSKFFLVFDRSRDVRLNTDVILLAKKQKKDKKMAAPSDLLSDAMDAFHIDSLREPGALGKLLREYYEKNEISFQFDDPSPTSFVSYTSDEYDSECPAGSPYRVVPNLVLGTFESSDASIKRDFDEIASKGKDIPANIRNLLSNSSEENYRERSSAGIADKVDVSERDILYINSLNSAQENIIKSLTTEDTVVIQGPPGTGKSQTICDIIVTEVSRGKSILVVAEKEPALSVIKSRLGYISDYIMMLPNAQEKDDFYSQVEKAIALRRPPETIDVGPMCSDIDYEIDSLSKVYSLVYKPMPVFDVEPYKLFRTGRSIDVSTADGLAIYNKALASMGDQVLRETYDVVTSAYNELSAESTRKIALDFIGVDRTFPWLSLINPDLKASEITQMVADAKAILEKPKPEKKGFKQLISMKDPERKDFEKKYLVKGADSAAIIESIGSEESICEIVERYRTTSQAFSTKDPAVRAMSYAAFDLSDGIKEDFPDGVEAAYNAIITKHLQDFYQANPGIVGIMQGFDSSIDRIEQKTQAKMAATRDNVQAKLIEDIHVLDPRIQDIAMELDKTDRFSVSKFLTRIPLFKAFRVWLMTPQSVSEVLPNERGMFDYVIIDEASQMFLERAIPSIYRGKKVVIAGDHKQLRPTLLGLSKVNWVEDPYDVDDFVDAALERESLLDMARCRYVNHVLNFHYRAQYEELIAFSNAMFYRNGLFVSPNVAVPETPPIEYHLIADGVWENKCNRVEAEAVIAWLSDFIRTRKNNETIGIVTFNLRQRDLILDMISKIENEELRALLDAEMHRRDNGESTELFVKNIENVQGDERDVIVFSIGYAKDPNGTFRKQFGSLNNPGGENRVNVAVSRAKKKVHVFASFEPADFDVSETKNEGPKVLASYLHYAKAVSDGSDDVRAILLRSAGMHDTRQKPSQAVEDLAAFLRSEGYSVEMNVGISTYNIDLAVYDRHGYVIGIEADCSVYPGMPSSRERDVHRLRYLRGRGWKICRFWVSEYWRNAPVEFERVLAAVEDASKDR